MAVENRDVISGAIPVIRTCGSETFGDHVNGNLVQRGVVSGDEGLGGDHKQSIQMIEDRLDENVVTKQVVLELQPLQIFERKSMCVSKAAAAVEWRPPKLAWIGEFDHAARGLVMPGAMLPAFRELGQLQDGSPDAINSAREMDPGVSCGSRKCLRLNSAYLSAFCG